MRLWGGGGGGEGVKISIYKHFLVQYFLGAQMCMVPKVAFGGRGVGVRKKWCNFFWAEPIYSSAKICTGVGGRWKLFVPGGPWGAQAPCMS